MKDPILQESLKEIHLLAILDLLMDNDEPLTIGQIQHRLGRDRNLSLSRDEIEALLRWGVNEPNATNAPVRVHPQPGGKWIAVAKAPMTAVEHRAVDKAAGPPPFEQPEHPPIRYLVWFEDGSNLVRTGTIAELAKQYGTAIKIEEL